MTNASPDSGPRPGRPVRDLAAINDSVELAEQARWDRAADDMELYSLDNTLLLGPAIYLISLFRRAGDGSFFAYAFWALAVLIWTPWLILRVDRARPPGDTARATAFLGYGLLGWPLSALVIEIVPEKWEFFTAFPVVFLWSVYFAWRGVRRGPRPAPSPRRVQVLAGGAAAYLVCALLLVAAAAWLWLYERARMADLASLVIGAISVIAFITAIPGLCLAPVAWKTWRNARAATAATP